MRKLTQKQEAFAREYLIDLNATRAAGRAGYSDPNIGRQLITKHNVSKAISAAIEDRNKRLDIDADYVLNRLYAEVEADLADLYNEDGTVKSVREMPLIWRQGLIVGLDVSQVLGDLDGTTTKIKISDRLKRIELIGKHVAVSAFQENMNLTSDLKGATKGDVLDMLKGLLRNE